MSKTTTVTTTVKKTYDLMVKLNVEFNMSVAASSLEEAVAKSKELAIEDVIGAIPSPGSCNDHGFEVIGVWKNE